MEGLVNMMEETVLKKIDKLWETTDGWRALAGTDQMSKM